MITLYQFTFSHFCEKARWALDYKSIPYEVRNLLPGFHMRTVSQLAPRTCLPIIVHAGRVIQGSPAIISYLDETFPDRPLTPGNSGEAMKASEWENHLDEEIGVPIRLWFYYHVLPDRERALRFMLPGSPPFNRLLFRAAFPKVRERMTKFMNIRAETASEAEMKFSAALQRLESAVAQRRFLVGNDFSRADLTACALLAPFCRPGETESDVSDALPEPVCARRAQSENSGVFRWVRDMYATHRRPNYGHGVAHGQTHVAH